MRALRDFNLPKIVTDDVTIIMGLIGDLFPALNVPRKRDMEFEEYVKKSVLVCSRSLPLLDYLSFTDNLQDSSSATRLSSHVLSPLS